MKVILLALVIAGLGGSVAAAGPSLKPLAAAPDWLGTRPDPAQLRGKVVIVDVFTFACINCKHVVPQLRSLYRTTSRNDLAIIGIHSPETAYERDRANVERNLALQGIAWPVALDNSFALWHAYGIEYWPTQLIFDRQGVLRDTIIGEGQDSQVRAVVASLIAEKVALGGRITKIDGRSPSGAVPNARRYAVNVDGPPMAVVQLRALGLPPKWVGSFCTPRICSPFGVSITLPKSGRLALEYQVIPDETQRLKPLEVQIQMTSGASSIRVRLQ